MPSRALGRTAVAFSFSVSPSASVSALPLDVLLSFEIARALGVRTSVTLSFHLITGIALTVVQESPDGAPDYTFACEYCPEIQLSDK